MQTWKNIFWMSVVVSALQSVTFTAIWSQGSQELFKILGAKNVFVLDATSQRPARAGIVLRSETILRVDTGGYVALVHYTGKSLELRNVGTYKSTELEQRLAQGQTSSTHKVATFVLNAMGQKNKSDSHRENMNTLGAVARMSTGDDKEVTVLVPRMGSVTDSAVFLQWYSDAAGGSQTGTGLVLPTAPPTQTPKQAPQSSKAVVYRIEIKSEQGKLLHALETTDTSLILKPALIGIQRGNLIRWTVNLLGSKARQEYNVRWLPQDDATALADTLATIQKEFPDTASPLGQILQGMLFERYECYTEAIRHYKAAIHNAPFVYDYNDALNVLMVKLGLNEDDIARLTFSISPTTNTTTIDTKR